MPLFDWLDSLRRLLRCSRPSTRLRKAIRRGWLSPLCPWVDRNEPRILLSAPVASNGSDAIHMNSPLTSMVSAYDPDMDPIALSVVAGPLLTTVENGGAGEDRGG